jgi:microcin C transport system substrate-binding protein
MKSFLLFSVFCGLQLFSFCAAAAEARPAMALHGEAKYPANFAHFSYVNPEAPKGGELRLSSIGSFDSLNPYIIKGSAADGISALTVTTLMEQSYDEPFSMYGLLAETVERADDHSSVTFNLRKIAQWADGKPITADDVVWSYETLTQKGSPFYKAYYADVKNVVAENSPARHLYLQNP